MGNERGRKRGPDEGDKTKAKPEGHARIGPALQKRSTKEKKKVQENEQDRYLEEARKGMILMHSHSLASKGRVRI